MSIHNKLVKKEPKKTDNEEKLKRKSIDDAYDGKIKDKISDVRTILSRLGSTITKKDKKKIKKELYEIENKKNLSDREKNEIYHHFVKLVRTFDKKEKYKHHDHADLNYHGIRDIENLFDDVNDISQKFF